MTYTVMVRLPHLGLLALASASGGVGVGSKVLWAKAGAVAVQGYANPSLGIAILEALNIGMNSSEALEVELSRDNDRELRQVAVLGASSRVATYTGSAVAPHKGAYVYSNAVCIGNTLKDSSIPEEMCRYISEQSMASVKEAVKALIIGHKLGGSRRGDKSIAILVINNTQRDKGYDRIVDVRVDYSSKPFNAVAKTLKMLGMW
jgi:uncharacterized Ntn-hydrolase superfamily protein